MSFFHNIILQPHFFSNRVYLDWNIVGNAEDFNFVIMKSTSVDGPFKYLGQVSGRTNFADPDLDVRTGRDKAFYRIYAQTSTGREESEIVSWSTHVDNRLFAAARTMIRQEMIANKTSGKEFYLFKRKLRGDKCTSCSFDEGGNLLIAGSMCGECYGTGIIGGYDEAVPAFGRWAQRTDGTIVETGEERKTDRKHTLRAVPYPSLIHADLVVDGFSLDRYLVVEHRPFLFADRIPVAADVTLHYLGRSDIRYSLPLPV